MRDWLESTQSGRTLLSVLLLKESRSMSIAIIAIQINPAIIVGPTDGDGKSDSVAWNDVTVASSP